MPFNYYRGHGLTYRQVSAIKFIEQTLGVRCERPLVREVAYPFLSKYLNKAKLKASGKEPAKMTNAEAFKLIFEYDSKSTSLT
jgi:hypothetical protein